MKYVLIGEVGTKTCIKIKVSKNPTKDYLALGLRFKLGFTTSPIVSEHCIW